MKALLISIVTLIMTGSYLSTNGVRPAPYSDDSHIIYNGPSGIESYWNGYIDFVIYQARCAGYSKNDYPYRIREDGCRMFGNYIICAADYDTYPYGSIIETSLGKGIVLDTGGTLCKDCSDYTHDVDIYVIWK